MKKEYLENLARGYVIPIKQVNHSQHNMNDKSVEKYLYLPRHISIYLVNANQSNGGKIKYLIHSIYLS